MNLLIAPKSIENACIFTDAESGVLEDSLDAIMAAVLERYNQDLQGSRGHKVLDDRKYVNLFFRLMREHPDYMPRSEYYAELGLKEHPSDIKNKLAWLLPEVLRQPYVHKKLVEIAEIREKPIIDALDDVYLECLSDNQAEQAYNSSLINFLFALCLAPSKGMGVFSEDFSMYRHHLSSYCDSATEKIRIAVADAVLRNYDRWMIGFVDRLEKGEIGYVRG